MSHCQWQTITSYTPVYAEVQPDSIVLTLIVSLVISLFHLHSIMNRGLRKRVRIGNSDDKSATNESKHHVEVCYFQNWFAVFFNYMLISRTFRPILNPPRAASTHCPTKHSRWYLKRSSSRSGFYSESFANESKRSSRTWSKAPVKSRWSSRN